MYTCVYVCMYVCPKRSIEWFDVLDYVYVHVCKHIYVCVCVFDKCAGVNVCMHTSMYMYVNIYIYVCVCSTSTQA